MPFLRLMAILWLTYVSLVFWRSFRANLTRMGAARRQQAKRPFTPPPPPPFGFRDPFGAYGPFGPGGPGPRSASAGARQRPREPRAPRASAASVKSPYEILQVAPGADAQQIRRAYQELVRQYHPDKLSGLGQELRELAEQRTKEITAAYNQLKAKR